jgi:spermidine synthase
MTLNSKQTKILIYSLVFYSGFANLATEIIGPRLVASLFGSTTIIWAIIISVTLIGISIGYYLGGRVPQDQVIKYFPRILILNAIWLLALSWLIWQIPAGFSSVGYAAIGITSFIAFFPPAVLFSMTSPLAISLIAVDRPKEAISREVGNIYALSTMGSVVGALAAAFILIPYVGLSTSLKLFAIIAVLYALIFLTPRLRLVGAALLVVCVIVPQPVYRWGEELGLTLLAQREGYYQTIRVFTDNSTFIQMNLGPTFHTQMNLQTKEPLFGYAREMIELAGDVQGKRVLIIGGAGHTIARALEKRGATVTEVEIDPFVVHLSDKFFGEIHGAVEITDGRAYLAEIREQNFDLIIVDAFDSLASVPPQLTTQEFFADVSRALEPDGRMFYNFIGVPEGDKSNSFRAISTTLASVFNDARASEVSGERLMNIILVASQVQMEENPFPQAPEDGTLLTDDLNPAEVYFEQARAGYYFH